MQLSERLRMNVSLVPDGKRVADIGCDHGYAAIWLTKYGNARKVVAMDVNRGPIECARCHVKEHGLEGQVECRLSDGTEALQPGEVDTLMMAGMGGPLMIRILETAEPGVMSRIDTLVMQPQSEIWNVRKFMAGIGFRIEEEKACIDDHKYYFAFRAVRQDGKPDREEKPEWEMRYGTYLIQTKNAVLRQYLEKERKTSRLILEKMCAQDVSLETRQEILHKIEGIEQCLRCFED